MKNEILNIYSFEKGILRLLFKFSGQPGHGAQCVFEDKTSGFSFQVEREPFRLDMRGKHEETVIKTVHEPNSSVELIYDENCRVEKVKLNFNTNAQYFSGFGERFDRVNQRGLAPDIHVIEEFGDQQKKTYMPVPFFLTEAGFGMYINSSFRTVFHLPCGQDDLLSIETNVNPDNPILDLYILLGTPSEILLSYFKLTGFPKLPPKWVFGPWMSSNGWNTQKETLEQVELMKKHDIPASVLVIEAWSDEATFYIFNGARYRVKPGGEAFTYSDFEFDKSGKWPDPKGMVDYIHENGLKLVLWQIPTIKYFENPDNKQHILDEEYTVEKCYCVMNQDGTPYRMPEDRWFFKSLVLDFTNPEAKVWWFNKLKYLLEDLKVDGFKTDGGEFIYDDNVHFFNGKNGAEMRNRYPIEYISAYHDFVGKDRITFSRSGFTGAQKYPLYWAGDQYSTFQQFRSVIRAGLTISTSGNPFWGFDISGFAGEMPSLELYIRSTQMAAFCPIMQFHSVNRETESNNDRSPWNVSRYHKDERILDIYRRYANIRMNLLPYIYNEARYVSKFGAPLMKPLIFEYPDDGNVYDIEDEYLFGRSMLISPVTEEGARQRRVYLPEGQWVDFWNGSEHKGGKWVNYACELDIIPVFIKEGSVIPLNLNDDLDIGGSIGNDINGYKILCFHITKTFTGAYVFEDNMGNRVCLKNVDGSMEASIDGNIEKIEVICDGGKYKRSYFRS